MFEKLIEQGEDQVRRLKITQSLSIEDIEKLPESSKVRVVEAEAWERAIVHGIRLQFGPDSYEMRLWNQIWEDYIAGVFGDSESYATTERKIAQVALLREFQAKYDLAVKMKKDEPQNMTINAHDHAIVINRPGDISGTVISANTIQKSFNKVASSSLSDELKDLLQELTIAVQAMSEELSESDALEVADDLEKLVDQSTSAKPNRKWWSVSIEGLSKAAENVGKVGEPVLRIVGRLMPVLVAASK